MPTRRPHTKTRHGCATCKARKVRCDEEKPICRNCTRGNRSCRYPNQVLALPNALAASPSDTQDRVFPLRDMELLHHYTSVVYATMTDNPDHDEIWRDTVPRMAFTYPFLLHGLLAVAALHRRHEADDTQKEILMDLARYHQQHALNLYIPLLQSIDEQNCHALFAFAILISIICFGMLTDEADDAPSLVARFVDVFDALSGTAVVAIEAMKWLQQGPLGPILGGLEPAVTDLTKTEPGMRTALEMLLERAEQECNQGSHAKAGIDAEARRQAYRDSIYALATIIAPAVYRNRPLSVVVSWPIMTGNAYIALLRHRDPLAIVILAHYGVALHKIDNLIWALEKKIERLEEQLEGLGRCLTETVAGEVDEEWLPYLTWARARVAEAPTPAPYFAPVK
ncbi:Putative zn(2)-C6 fungal-type DNA-binding domain, fungal transcription factor [Septoria linicola]|uniref:Zn(2)-C6 fungal-type DNA-binding domain, fungal transcription factor n=1 Tax=Septoria linicola TaxID=215465 RepID=A0A9Q9ASH7_9PEZI|nr:Putative zn(2)-C6 fungal-type DNA-binding domain, fungal transcription factor [Septoria linicola]